MIETKYIDAERTLELAEREAWSTRDWESLSRLYMPLQEARRQRRQRCGEGIVALNLIAQGPGDHVDGRHVVENFSHGQLLVAGWGSIEPAREVRKLQIEFGLYVETFLAAVYPIEGRRKIVLVPLEDTALPEPLEQSLDELIQQLPPHCVVLDADELPAQSQRGDTNTYARTMALWEQLHAPFVRKADEQTDPLLKIEGFRKAIRVDYASELAHQKLSQTAMALARQQRQGAPASVASR